MSCKVIEDTGMGWVGAPPVDLHFMVRLETSLPSVSISCESGLNEGQKIAYEVAADKRIGKSSADNLKSA
jgi:hypothetical protein